MYINSLTVFNSCFMIVFDFGDTDSDRVANRPEFFGTVPKSDAVSHVPNGSVRDRLMSRIFTEQKSNVNKDPYFRFFAFDLCI